MIARTRWPILDRGFPFSEYAPIDREMESEGNSWYNGLEASLTKRLGHGVQFLASYTFSKTLDTDGADINSTSSGNALTLGDQNSPRQRWGRASSDRTHRFIFSETWTLPSPSEGLRRALLGGWEVASVVTIQSGSALTISDTNANNVFGISEDRAQLSGTCSKTQLIKEGSVGSRNWEELFQCPLFYGAANNRRRQYRHRIWKQRHRYCRWPGTGRHRSCSLKKHTLELAF